MNLIHSAQVRELQHAQLPKHIMEAASNDLLFILNKRSIPAKDQEKVIYWALSQKSSTPLKGMLLYGPPGTGKTALVKILKPIIGAKEIIEAGPSDMQTAAQVKAIFEHARKKSEDGLIILFLDELDDLLFANKSLKGETLKLETLLETKNKSIWQFIIEKDKQVVGYIKFSKEDRDGIIDLFHIESQFRGKNFDSILMYAALDKLFLDADVDVVILSPAPFAHGTENLTQMDIEKLKNYYKTKYGFEQDPDTKHLFLTKSRYLLFKALKSKPEIRSKL